MSNILPALRIIGWLGVMAIAIAASSASVMYAYRYGITLWRAAQVAKETEDCPQQLSA